MDKDSEKNKVAKNSFIQVGPFSLDGSKMTCTDNGATTSWYYSISGGLQRVNTKPTNPYIPLKIYCNSETGTTLVKWSDGTETKVTCDKEDNFSPESGYFAALAIKVFGNDKKKFKDFWYPVISRRTIVDGKKMKPVAYGKWEKQRMEANDRRKRRTKRNFSIKQAGKA
jgi:hypothetical protein